MSPNELLHPGLVQEELVVADLGSRLSVPQFGVQAMECDAKDMED